MSLQDLNHCQTEVCVVYCGLRPSHHLHRLEKAGSQEWIPHVTLALDESTRDTLIKLTLDGNNQLPFCHSFYSCAR